MKKVAVVVSGWHFSLHFYEEMAAQEIPSGWTVEYFVVSHRDPHFSAEEKQKFLAGLGDSRRDLYDKVLYREVATVEQIEKLGWHYVLEPNTIGDWGNTNQWLEKHDFKEYDMLLISHDDNYILNRRLFIDLLDKQNWLVLTNSLGVPPGNLRGSFEFFTKEMMEIMGGKFDLSMTTLTREGQFTTEENMSELGNWNTTVYPLKKFIESNKLQSKIKVLSPYYRMSLYCLEGERGFISKTYHLNTGEEEKGLDVVDKFLRLKTEGVVPNFYDFTESAAKKISFAGRVRNKLKELKRLVIG